MIKRISLITVLVALASCAERTASVTLQEAADSELMLLQCSTYANEGDPNKERWFQLRATSIDKAKTLRRDVYKRFISAGVDAMEKLGSAPKYPGDTPDSFMKRQISPEKCKTSERTLLLFLKQIDEERQF